MSERLIDFTVLDLVRALDQAGLAWQHMHHPELQIYRLALQAHHAWDVGTDFLKIVEASFQEGLPNGVHSPQYGLDLSNQTHGLMTQHAFDDAMARLAGGH